MVHTPTVSSFVHPTFFGWTLFIPLAVGSATKAQSCQASLSKCPPFRSPALEGDMSTNIWLVVQSRNHHLEKWWSESQWEGWHPIYDMEKNTHVLNHQSDMSLTTINHPVSFPSSYPIHIHYPLVNHQSDMGQSSIDNGYNGLGVTHRPTDQLFLVIETMSGRRGNIKARHVPWYCQWFMNAYLKN